MLFIVSALSALALSSMRAKGALIMLLRARWLILSLLLIYSLATPGEAAFPALGGLSPTLQGLHGGALQAWRLALLLVTLALLMQAYSRENLLSGIYILLRPFRLLGLNPEQIAVRLWLTLHYAQQQPRKSIADWWQDLRDDTGPAPGTACEISLELAAFTWQDGLALSLSMLLMGWSLW